VKKYRTTRDSVYLYFKCDAWFIEISKSIFINREIAKYHL